MLFLKFTLVLNVLTIGVILAQVSDVTEDEFEGLEQPEVDVIKTTPKPDRNGQHFSYTACEHNNDSNATVRVGKVEAKPDPVRLNGELRFSMDVTFDTDIPLDSEIALNIYKPVELFGNKMNLRIPCMAKFGSCKYKLCRLADLMKDEICKLLPASQPCTCPFTAGRYVLEDALVKIPKLSESLVRLALGDYYGDVKLTSGGQEMACVKYTVRLVRNE